MEVVCPIVRQVLTIWDMHFRFLYQPEPTRLSTRSKRWTLDVDAGRWTSLNVGIGCADAGLILPGILFEW